MILLSKNYMTDTLTEVKCCNRCKQIKPLNEFWKNGRRNNGKPVKDLYRGDCAICEREKRLPKLRAAGVRHRHGIELSEYERMYKEQNGLCAICNGLPQREHLDIDHCHQSSKIRGLLCGKCNKGIGLFNDDIERLEQAVKYLKTALNGAETHI